MREMQVYLVGGAVRDELLGLPVKERDWVVVGATPAEMERRGYRAVGRDFPVFLHPDNNEEYALARLERKIAPGYRGFSTEAAPTVTLEEDLKRRDLTINAMARSSDGAIIDPYGGQADLRARLLRHVSPAFSEDPVRILRVARFAARFEALGFSIAEETLRLMRHMVDSGEVQALVPERVWRELERALSEPRPDAFFSTLQQCGALAAVLPELAEAFAQPDTVLAPLRSAVAAGAGAPVRLAALLGGQIPQAIEALARRLRLPNECRELALLAARLLPRLLSASPGADAALTLLESADAFRRPDRFEQLLQVAAAHGLAAADRWRWRALRELLSSVALSPQEYAALKGPEIAATLHARRLAEIKALPR
jgi:tRNA nucleotidyltransferase (CCA-adding enzyme)